MSRKIRMGMVGGGRDAFIGAVHRMAAALDGHIELVCGAFSSDPDKSRASGADLYLPADRVYGTYPEMMEREAALPDGERMDFVSIVHAQQRPLPGSQGGARGRLPRHERQAHDLQPGRGAGAARAGPVHRAAVRAHPQLLRLSHGQGGEAAGPRRLDRPHPQGGGRVPAGVAGQAGGSYRHEAGRVANRSRAGRHQLLHRRHRHPR